MTEQRVQGRLAAILAADVFGYSALMQRAEEATYAEFERLKHEVIEPSLSRHDGRLIKTTGDGALAEFASPSAAERCAVEVQESIASGRSSLKLRIGINLGEPVAFLRAALCSQTMLSRNLGDDMVEVYSNVRRDLLVVKKDFRCRTSAWKENGARARSGSSG
ncbi:MULTISPECIES: adenylate/guanylate cyclase domain-containing protein [unclassified Bradyrhizobium]